MATPNGGWHPSRGRGCGSFSRRYLETVEPDHVIVKLDFKNAFLFNSIRRDKMMRAVAELVPYLLPLVHSAYSSPSLLFWGDTSLRSVEGVQQEDPLGPLLFCLTIHHLVQQLKSEFCTWYLDDGTIRGSSDEVLADMHKVERMAAELGHCLNMRKSEIICKDPSTLKCILPRSRTLGRLFLRRYSF